MRILAVAQNTFREAVRDKVLYVLLLFAATTVLGSKALGWISIGQDIKIVKDISLAAVSIFGVLIAIFVGTNLVYKEIDKRTIYTIICRPMARYEFILGKYLGMALLLAVVTIVMTLVTAAYVLDTGRFTRRDLLPGGSAHLLGTAADYRAGGPALVVDVAHTRGHHRVLRVCRGTCDGHSH